MSADSLGLTELFHVGLVVNDLDDAVRRYSTLGVGPWATFDGEFLGEYRGREMTAAARVGFARTGSTYIELVQPTKGEWAATVYLAERGEGAYHLGYWVDDLDATLARAIELGYTTDIVSKRRDFAYLDPRNSAGVSIELVSTRLRPGIEQLVDGAAGG